MVKRDTKPSKLGSPSISSEDATGNDVIFFAISGDFLLNFPSYTKNQCTKWYRLVEDEETKILGLVLGRKVAGVKRNWLAKAR